MKENKLLSIKSNLVGLFVIVIFKDTIGMAIRPIADAISEEYHFEVCDKYT